MRTRAGGGHSSSEKARCSHFGQEEGEIGSRFSTVLLALADQSQILALFFAMVVSIILGMGMPITAAYAVAASVIAPGVGAWVWSPSWRTCP